MIGSTSNLILSGVGVLAGRRKAGVMGVMGASRGCGVLGTEGAGEAPKVREGGKRGAVALMGEPMGEFADIGDTMGEDGGPARRPAGSKADGS